MDQYYSRMHTIIPHFFHASNSTLDLYELIHRHLCSQIRIDHRQGHLRGTLRLLLEDGENPGLKYRGLPNEDEGSKIPQA